MDYKGRHPSLIVAALLLLLAVLVLTTAYSYSGGSGVYPKFIGWIFLILCLLDFSMRVVYLVYKLPELGIDSFDTERVLKPDSVFSEIKGFLWLGVLLISIYFAGFIITIPVYTFAFFRLAGHKPARECILYSALLTGFIYILFVRLLEYRLFPGILTG